MAVDAMLAVRHQVEGSKTYKFPVKAVNVLKAHGKCARDSIFLKGFALNCTVASQGKHVNIFHRGKLKSTSNEDEDC